MKSDPLVGQPRRGLHRARIPLLDVALFDTAATVGVAVAIGWRADLPSPLVFTVLFLFSVAVHLMAGVRTRVVDRAPLGVTVGTNGALVADVLLPDHTCARRRRRPDHGGAWGRPTDHHHH